MTGQPKYGAIVKVDDGFYPVNDLYLSVQGEGFHTGTAAIFLRLQGCNVGCSFCDTKETWLPNGALASAGLAGLAETKGKNGRYSVLTPAEIVEACRALAQPWQNPSKPMVVITGGEPALYPLAPLANALKSAGYYVCVETSGTALGIFAEDADDPFPGESSVPGTLVADWTTCSPKFGMQAGLVVWDSVLAACEEIKLVVGKEADLERAHGLREQYPHKFIYLQPMSMLPKSTLLCIDAVKTGRFRLSAQLHNYLNLP